MTRSSESVRSSWKWLGAVVLSGVVVLGGLLVWRAVRSETRSGRTATVGKTLAVIGDSGERLLVGERSVKVPRNGGLSPSSQLQVGGATVLGAAMVVDSSAVPSLVVIVRSSSSMQFFDADSGASLGSVGPNVSNQALGVLVAAATTRFEIEVDGTLSGPLQATVACASPRSSTVTSVVSTEVTTLKAGYAESDVRSLPPLDVIC